MSEETKANSDIPRKKENPTITRRNVIKALAGLPVLGAFGVSAIRNKNYKERKFQYLSDELGLDELRISNQEIRNDGNNDLLRVGIIGFGSRAKALSNGLGYMHPDDVKKKNDESLQTWLSQRNLNTAITGICEVFDLRAQNGLETANNQLHPGGMPHPENPVKRYLNYKEMLDDKDIDGVIIATPDHWHAQMTIDAIEAGKHVYLEKCLTNTEEELYKVYDVVKNSKQVFQLGHQITKNRIFQQAKEMLRKGIIGDVSMAETTTNRNTARGAWIRHLDDNGDPLPGNENSIDWEQWLGPADKVPFSIDRYYNWTKWFDYSRGMLGQLFSHEYDAINQLLLIGIPERVTASGDIYYWKDNREIPDVFQASFLYPKKKLNLTYSGNLASSFKRSRKLMGRDATMELDAALKLTADQNSDRYSDMMDKGIIDSSSPMLNLDPMAEDIDAVSSATEQYYASRGLTYTLFNGKKMDITHLHLAEWIDCIRNGGLPSANIERSFEEGITIQMAHRSYLEKREVYWDADKRRIV